MVTAFKSFKDTSIYERHMLNAAQFSAAKSAAEAKMIQSEIFNEDKSVRTYKEFEKKATEITNISQKTWLRTEYETQRRQCVMGEQYRGMMEDADLYPYWVYKGVMDDRERESHVEMEGLIFRIGDPDGDACFPPNEDNCRCDGEPVNDLYLEEHKAKALTNDEAKKYLEDNVDERFRTNPAVDGSMPSTGSYFDVMANANQGTWQQFGLDSAVNMNSDDEMEGFAANGMHHIVEVVHQWRQDEHVNKKGEIVFQNKELFSNIKFTAGSLHNVQKHPRGFENIPVTVTKPDEVWMSWENTSNQKVALRNYIKFGKVAYIVQTRNGVITDAFAVTKASANKFRKGVIA